MVLKTPQYALTLLFSLIWPQGHLSTLTVAKLFPTSGPPPHLLSLLPKPLFLSHLSEDVNRFSKSCLKCHIFYGAFFHLPSPPSEVTLSVSPPHTPFLFTAIITNCNYILIYVFTHLMPVSSRGKASCPVTHST